MDFGKAVLVSAAQVHDRREIDLVERGEDGGGVLRGDEAFGDALADFAHGHAACAGGIGGDRRRRKLHRRRHNRRRRGLFFQMCQNVLLGQSATGSGGGHGGDVELIFLHQPAHGGA